MNVQLEKIHHRLRLNKFSPKIDKTHHVIFMNSPQNYPSIEIRNNPLVKVTELKLFGVFINNRLSFKAPLKNNL